MMVATASGFSLVATFAGGVLLARLLSVEDRGFVALVIFWASLAAALGSLSLPDAFVVGAKDNRQSLRNVVTTMLVVMLGCGLLAASIALGFVALFAERFSLISPAFVMFMMVTLIAQNYSNGALSSIERADLNFKRLSIEQAALPIIYALMLAATGVAIGLTIELVLIIYLVSRFPVLAIRLLRYRRDFSLTFDSGFARRSMGTGIQFHGIAIVKMISEQADRLAVNSQWALSEIAYYAVGASTVGAALSLVSQALGQVSLPLVSKLDEADVVDHFTQSLRITSILLLCAMIPLALIAPVIVPLLFGADYVEAVIITQVLAFALLPGPLVAQTDAVLRARGFVTAAFRLHVITLAVIAIGWLVSGYGDIVSLGVAIAAARIFALLATLLTIKRQFSELRITDCIVWRASDFQAIWRAVVSVAARMRIGRS